MDISFPQKGEVGQDKNARDLSRISLLFLKKRNSFELHIQNIRSSRSKITTKPSIHAKKVGRRGGAGPEDKIKGERGEIGGERSFSR